MRVDTIKALQRFIALVGLQPQTRTHATPAVFLDEFFTQRGNLGRFGLRPLRPLILEFTRAVRAVERHLCVGDLVQTPKLFHHTNTHFCPAPGFDIAHIDRGLQNHFEHLARCGARCERAR